MIIKKYEDIKKHINEGDVLLFRGKGLTSKLISSQSQTSYSHVGIASWVNGCSNTEEGILECVEFKEGSIVSGILGKESGGGGHSVNLYQVLLKNNGIIDVYRPDPIFFKYRYNGALSLEEKEFVGKNVTKVMRHFSGVAYGWKRIWWMFLHKTLIWKLFNNTKKLEEDQVKDLIYPVCSTSIAYAFNINGYDLVKNRSDEFCEPGDIAKSPSLNYLFTLEI